MKRNHLAVTDEALWRFTNCTSAQNEVAVLSRQVVPLNAIYEAGLTTYTSSVLGQGTHTHKRKAAYLCIEVLSNAASVVEPCTPAQLVFTTSGSENATFIHPQTVVVCPG
jgi:hypothetical protein